MTQRVIDCLVNVHFGETEVQPQFLDEGARRLLQKGPKSMFDPWDLGELLDEIWTARASKAVLMDNLGKPSSDGPQVRRGPARSVRARDGWNQSAGSRSHRCAN